MRSPERIILYVVAGVVAVTLLERARAQDPPAPAPQQAQTATALEIKNRQGVTVVRLSAGPDGGGLIELFSKAGKKAASLFAHAKGGMLATQNTGTGKGVAYVGTASDTGNGMVTIRNEKDVLGAGLFTADFGGYARFFGRTGKITAIVGSEAGDAAGGYVAILGPEGKKAIEAYTHKKGGLLSLRNVEHDRNVVTIGSASDTGTGLLSLSTEKGVRSVVSFGTKDGGQLKVLNAQGKTAAYSGALEDGTGHVFAARSDGSKIVEFGRNAHLGGYLSILNGLGKRVVYLGATTRQPQGDGTLEVSRNNGKVGVVLRALMSGSYVSVHDAEGKLKNKLK